MSARVNGRFGVGVVVRQRASPLEERLVLVAVMVGSRSSRADTLVGVPEASNDGMLPGPNRHVGDVSVRAADE